MGIFTLGTLALITDPGTDGRPRGPKRSSNNPSGNNLRRFSAKNRCTDPWFPHQAPTQAQGVQQFPIQLLSALHTP